MPRPILYTEEDVIEIIRLKAEEGIPIKRSCRDKGFPYVSIRKAMTRYGLKTPEMNESREGRHIMGRLIKADNLDGPTSELI